MATLHDCTLDMPIGEGTPTEMLALGKSAIEGLDWQDFMGTLQAYANDGTLIYEIRGGGCFTEAPTPEMVIESVMYCSCGYPLDEKGLCDECEDEPLGEAPSDPLATLLANISARLAVAA